MPGPGQCCIAGLSRNPAVAASLGILGGGPSPTDPALLAVDVPRATFVAPQRTGADATFSSTARRLRGYRHAVRLRISRQIGTPSETLQAREKADGSYLLNLPSELRELIYCFALINHSSFDLDFACNFLDWQRFAEPPLTRVNRQIRSECLHIFYAENVFQSLRHEDIVFFLAALTKPKLSFLRTIRYSSICSGVLFPLYTLRPAMELFQRQGLRRDTLHVLLRVKGEGEIYVPLYDLDWFVEVDEIVEERGYGKLFARKSTRGSVLTTLVAPCGCPEPHLAFCKGQAIISLERIVSVSPTGIVRIRWEEVPRLPLPG